MISVSHMKKIANLYIHSFYEVKGGYLGVLKKLTIMVPGITTEETE